MIVERATEDDLEGIIDVDAAQNGTPRVAYLVDAVKKRECYIARENWEVVGYVLLTRQFFGYSFMEMIIVLPEYRRKGVASTLLRHIEKILPSQKLFTWTKESNKPMLSLFERL